MKRLTLEEAKTHSKPELVELVTGPVNKLNTAGQVGVMLGSTVAFGLASGMLVKYDIVSPTVATAVSAAFGTGVVAFADDYVQIAGLGLLGASAAQMTVLGLGAYTQGQAKKVAALAAQNGIASSSPRAGISADDESSDVYKEFKKQLNKASAAAERNVTVQPVAQAA